MKKNYLYCAKSLLFCLVLLMSSCYNDDGNYDYKTIDEVTIQWPAGIADTLQVSAGDSVKLAPLVAFAGDSTRLKYEWKIFNNSLEKDPVTNLYPSAVVLSDKKVLNYAVTQGPGQYTLVYTVTDPGNGVKTYKALTVVVETLKGMVLLIKKADGTNELDVIRDGRLLLDGLPVSKYGVAYDLFAGSNDGEKLKGVKSIYRGVYRASAAFVFDDDLYLFGDSLAYKLSTSNYKATSRSSRDYFFLPPPTTNVTAQVMSKGQKAELITIDGRLYCFPRYYVGNTKFGLDIAPGDSYHAASFLPYFPVAGTAYSTVIFDTKNRSFRPVDQFGTSLLTLSDTLTKPFDMKLVPMTLKYMENGNLNYTYSVFHDDQNQNKPTLLVANFAVVSGAIAKPIYRIDLSGLPEIANAVDYTFSTKGHVMFYASPTTLYSATYRDGNFRTAYTPAADEKITHVKILKDDFNLNYDGKILTFTTQNSQTSEWKTYIVQFNGTNGTLDLNTLKVYKGSGEILQWTINN